MTHARRQDCLRYIRWNGRDSLGGRICNRRRVFFPWLRIERCNISFRRLRYRNNWDAHIFYCLSLDSSFVGTRAPYVFSSNRILKSERKKTVSETEIIIR